MNAEKWVRRCLSKKKLSQGYADNIIEKSTIPLMKYYCPHCFNWHLAKDKNKINQNIINYEKSI